MSPSHLVLVEQARLVTDELVRCAILWHEQWNEGLDEASKLYFQVINYSQRKRERERGVRERKRKREVSKWVPDILLTTDSFVQDRNVPGMLAVLDPLHKLIEAGANTLKVLSFIRMHDSNIWFFAGSFCSVNECNLQEHSFNQTYFADLQDARKFCQAYVKSKQVKELSQAWEVYYAVSESRREENR